MVLDDVWGNAPALTTAQLWYLAACAALFWGLALVAMWTWRYCHK